LHSNVNHVYLIRLKIPVIGDVFGAYRDDSRLFRDASAAENPFAGVITTMWGGKGGQKRANNHAIFDLALIPHFRPAVTTREILVDGRVTMATFVYSPAPAKCPNTVYINIYIFHYSR